MNATLLTNKLVVPVAHDLIHRQALCEQLQSKQNTPLIVLQAAAGFGKTSLVCDWLQYSGQTVAWYSLDYADNIPTTFWKYLCEALSQFHPSISEEAKLFLTNQSINNVLPICDSVISGLNQFTRHRLRPDRCVLVLDDFHLIHDKHIIESISRFIDYKPYWLQVIITSRTLPDLRIANRISKQQAVIISSQELMFDRSTCIEVLTRQFNNAPTEQVLNYIFEQSRGWPAAVQLLIRLNGISEPNTDSPAIQQELIADYLMEEVFLSLDENTRKLLYIICILPRFNLSIINMIVDSPVTKPQFEKLIHSGVLISSTQNQSSELFYKIHDLFRDWLESNLNTNNPNQVKTLRYKAIQSLIKIEAYNDALALAQKNKDWALASNILGHHLYNDYQVSHFDFIQYQLNKFPEEQFNILPTLCLLKVNLSFHQNNKTEFKIYLNKGNRAIENIQSTINDNNLKYLTEHGLNDIEEFHIVKNSLNLLENINMLYDGKLPELKTLSEKSYLNENNPLNYWRDHLKFITAFMEEDFKKAIELGNKTLNTAKEMKDINCSTTTACWLAQSLYQSGHVKTAFHILNETKEWLTKINALNSPVIPAFYATLGFMHLENLEFTKAFEMYDLVEKNISEFSEPRSILYNQYHFKMRLLICTKQYEAAGEWLKKIHEYEENHLRTNLNDSTFICQPDTILIEILYQLKLGNTMPIIQWAMSYEAPEYSPPIKQSVETWVQAIGFMFCGQDQMDVLESLLQDAITNNNKARQVSLNFTKATLLFTQGEIEKSTELLINTLKLARDSQYKQLVLDANPHVLTRLNELQSHAEVGNYCQLLLQADKEKSSSTFNVNPDVTDTQPNIHISNEPTEQLEQLTKREQEILQLLAKSMRNQDIANQLGISLPTVKRHIQNVYAKLNINSRTEAALIYTQAQHT